MKTQVHHEPRATRPREHTVQRYSKVPVYTVRRCRCQSNWNSVLYIQVLEYQVQLPVQHRMLLLATRCSADWSCCHVVINRQPRCQNCTEKVLVKTSCCFQSWKAFMWSCGRFVYHASCYWSTGSMTRNSQSHFVLSCKRPIHDN